MSAPARTLTDAELPLALEMVAAGASTDELAARFGITRSRWWDRSIEERGKGRAPHPRWFALCPARQGQHRGPSLRDEHFDAREREAIAARTLEVQAGWDAETERSRRLTFAADLPGGRNHVRRERQWDRRSDPASPQHAQAAARGRSAARAW